MLFRSTEQASAEEEEVTGQSNYIGVRFSPYATGNTYQYHMYIDTILYSDAGKSVTAKRIDVYRCDSNGANKTKISSTETDCANVKLTDMEYLCMDIYGVDTDGAQCNVYVNPLQVKFYHHQAGVSVQTGEKNQVQLNLQHYRRSSDYGNTYFMVNMTPISGYEIYRSTNAKKGYKQIGSTDTEQYIDKTAADGKKYYYKARPFFYDQKTNKRIYGHLSEAVEYQTGVGAIESFEVSRAGSTSVKLSWTKAAGADRYEIYYARKRNGVLKYKCAGTTKKVLLP